MEQHKNVDYDSDIIYCDNIPETILVTSSPEKSKSKKQKKKRKRKAKRCVSYDNMENLLITQKIQVKKTKFKCIININGLCRERSTSIVRADTNVCKKEAYYHRMVPLCLRRTCRKDIHRSCCRSGVNKVYKEELSPKCGSVSPISSLSLTDIFRCNNLSYEEVSNGNFSSDFEEELDTLIRRTKQREKHFEQLNSSRRYVSTPLSKMGDITSPSPYSVDMDKSIHSDTTMILNPLSSDAYSPSVSLDAFKIDNVERPDLNMIANNQYSPAMTPILVKKENAIDTLMNRANSCNQDDIPYSSTYTQESMEIENIGFVPIMGNHTPYEFYNAPYSSTYTPEWKSYNLTGSTSNHNDANVANGSNVANVANVANGANVANDAIVPYSIVTQDLIKKDPNKSTTRTNACGNVAYSPSSPTLSPDLNKMKKTNDFTYNETDNANYLNGGYSSVNITKLIKRENEGSAAVISELIKVERNDPSNLNATDINMNQTICKKEKEDDQSETNYCIYNQDVANKMIVKVEKNHDDVQNSVLDVKPVQLRVETVISTNNVSVKSVKN